MPEAEDVLLEAAERAAHGLRRLLASAPRSGDDAVSRFARESRRLDAWLRACFGRSWPIAPSDAPLPPGWLRRTLERTPPFLRATRAQASTDGRSLVLPRDIAEGPGGRSAGELRLLMALGLGVRLERESVTHVPRDPLARDVFWSIEGALADARLGRELPGLAGSLHRARHEALARRPAPALMREAERAAEALVRRLLATEPAAALGGLLPDDPAPAEVRRFAERFAAAQPDTERRRYRGLADVAHWGAARPRAPAGPGADAGASAPPPARRARTLSRRLEARTPDPEELEGRAGPFVLPFGDPKLSVQDPGGVVRPTDQGEESELDALRDELSRLAEAPRIESGAAVREVIASEEEASATRAPAAGSRADGGAAHLYPEWDFRLGAYRRDHCRVREALAPPGDLAEALRLAAARASVIRELRRRFEALRPKRRRRPREPEGDAVDLDAWRDDWAALRAGRSPDGRIYTCERRERRDVAVTLLLDTSGSTDTWVSGRSRVIDVEKEALLCFCEALGALGDRHAVLSFSGHGPASVRTLRVKGFRERLGDAVRARIAGLEPDGFTRLGAAIRHATATLAGEASRARLLLVLSDAKPYDQDEYAGDYGIEDARQAVAEATRIGIRVFCVNVDRTGPPHLARVFGVRGYTSLWNFEQLPRRLPELYRQLTAGL